MRFTFPLDGCSIHSRYRLKTANKVELQQLYYNQLRDDFGI